MTAHAAGRQARRQVCALLVLYTVLTSVALSRPALPRREIVSVTAINEATTAWQAQPHRATFFIGVTQSMEPYASWWDTCFVEAVGIDYKLLVGEVYLYEAKWMDEYLVIHELMRVSGKMCLFKGTNNRSYDPWVERRHVRYVVRRILGTRANDFHGRMNP